MRAYLDTGAPGVVCSVGLVRSVSQTRQPAYVGLQCKIVNIFANQLVVLQCNDKLCWAALRLQLSETETIA